MWKQALQPEGTDGGIQRSCEIDFSVRESFALNSFVAPEALLESLQADGVEPLTMSWPNVGNALLVMRA